MTPDPPKPFIAKEVDTHIHHDMITQRKCKVLNEAELKKSSQKGENAKINAKGIADCRHTQRWKAK